MNSERPPKSDALIPAPPGSASVAVKSGEQLLTRAEFYELREVPPEAE